MPVLKSARHERFAQLRAQGISQTKAALQAGYAESRAPSQGCVLAKRQEVKDRIAELTARVEQVTIATSGITKAWVIETLVQNIIDAKADKQYGVVRATAVDLGKEIGMFVDKTHHTVEFKGFVELLKDPSRMSPEQLDQVTEVFDYMAYGEDQARKMAEQRRVLSEAGAMTVDLEPVKADSDTKTADSDTNNGEA